MTADLDNLLTALYVELTGRIIPFREPGRRGPGRPPDVTDAELACLAVAQALPGATTSGTGCAPPRAWPGTCSPGCRPRASTTPGCGRSRR